MDIPGNEISKPSSGKYFQKYLQFAISLISTYKGGEPFHLYIKKYFSANKKHGSKDRKHIASLCYNYFRLGGGVAAGTTVEDKILLGAFLCNSGFSVSFEQSKPAWNDMADQPLGEKLKAAEGIFDSGKIFPFQRFLSNEIDSDKFADSFLQQPKLFLRIRPGKETVVFEKIRAANFSFTRMNSKCLVFSNNEKISGAISLDKEAVIQDFNSQRTGDFFSKYFFEQQAGTDLENKNSQIAVWDCCAGSGGKSILAIDTLKNIKLTVTDKRLSILENLKKRFEAATIKHYDAFVWDGASGNPLPASTTFRFVIADVPCSGSGTWSRTPEQLTFFKENEIEKYASLQKSIVRNIIPYLEIGGILFYITCSVFKKENEENVDYILENFQFELLEKEYLKGYETQADTLFIAVLRKKINPVCFFKN